MGALALRQLRDPAQEARAPGCSPASPGGQSSSRSPGQEPSCESQQKPALGVLSGTAARETGPPRSAWRSVWGKWSHHGHVGGSLELVQFLCTRMHTHTPVHTFSMCIFAGSRRGDQCLYSLLRITHSPPYTCLPASLSSWGSCLCAIQPNNPAPPLSRARVLPLTAAIFLSSRRAQVPSSSLWKHLGSRHYPTSQARPHTTLAPRRIPSETPRGPGQGMSAFTAHTPAPARGFCVLITGAAPGQPSVRAAAQTSDDSAERPPALWPRDVSLRCLK